MRVVGGGEVKISVIFCINITQVDFFFCINLDMLLGRKEVMQSLIHCVLILSDKFKF